jgi:organic hydroperoxide reductase OsmC/OhrA
MAHLHTALIRWQLGDADFLGKRYSRAHTWTFDGGVVVPASSSPHVVPVPMSDAGAVDPEEAFVAALSSCHMLWFLDIASRAGWAVESYEDAADGRMARNAAGKLVVDVVTLRPRVRFAGGRLPGAEALAALHHKAHEECFLANSVRCEIRCEPVPE